MNETMRYRQALQGVASCATECGCCEMHVRIARAALLCGEALADGRCPRHWSKPLPDPIPKCEVCGAS